MFSIFAPEYNVITTVPLLKGILVGLATAIILGPVFFTLLKNALDKGTRAGVMTATGIIVSDIIVVSICYVFTAKVLDELVHLPWFKFFAAAILIVFAIGFIRNPLKAQVGNSSEKKQSNGLFKSFYQGFLVNGVNPAVFVIWMGFVGFGRTLYSSDIDLRIYLVGILIGIFATDLGKAYAASFLSTRLKSKNLPILFKVFGSVLIVLAGRLIYMGIADMM